MHTGCALLTSCVLISRFFRLSWNGVAGLRVTIFVVVLFAVLVDGRLLVLLVLGHQIVHVGLGLGKLHLVHAFAGVPVQECLTSEHGRELFGHALEHLLNGGRVADERG